jgi:hypothetical protein
MNNSLDILTRIDDLYNHAFTNLLYFTSGLIAIVGILMPILTQLYHNRVIRIAKEDIKSELQSELLELVSKLKLEFTEERKAFEVHITELNTSLKNELDRRVSASLGFSAMHQGAACIKDKNYYVAAISYLHSSRFFATAKDDINVQRSLKACDDCIDKLTKEQIEEDEFCEAFKWFMAEMEKTNLHKRYSDDISNFKRTMKKKTQQGAASST